MCPSATPAIVSRTSATAALTTTSLSGSEPHESLGQGGVDLQEIVGVGRDNGGAVLASQQRDMHVYDIGMRTAADRGTDPFRCVGVPAKVTTAPAVVLGRLPWLGRATIKLAVMRGRDSSCLCDRDE